MMFTGSKEAFTRSVKKPAGRWTDQMTHQGTTPLHIPLLVGAHIYIYTKETRRLKEQPKTCQPINAPQTGSRSATINITTVPYTSNNQ